MALTEEQIGTIKAQIDGVWDALDPLDRADMEAVSKVLDANKSALAGSGSDTSEGNEFALIIKGTKV